MNLCEALFSKFDAGLYDSSFSIISMIEQAVK